MRVGTWNLEKGARRKRPVSQLKRWLTTAST
jgi:hypothetical protein